MAQPLMTVEVPDGPVPRKGGLLAHADVQEVSGSRLLGGAEYKPAVVCGPLNEVPDWCADPRLSKQFDEDGWAEAMPFSAYKGLECGLFNSQALQDRASAALRWGVGIAAEQALVQTFEADADLETVDAGSGADALLAYLEERAGTLPDPHIVIPRSDVPYLRGHVQSDGNSGLLYTRQGTPIVNISTTGGVTSGLVAYVTGGLHVWLGDPVATEGLDPETNLRQVVAEQVGALAYDCGVTKVTATTGGTP